MKNTLFLTLGVLMLSSLVPRTVFAGGKPGWTDNQAKGMQEAKSANKLLLMDFTGSDWCSWCKQLDKEVFSTPEFQEYAKKNLVLVELDFPNQKAITPETKKQNTKLKQQYGVEGFPTIIVLNSQGKKVGELGYMEGGPKAFIAALEKLPKA